MRKISDERVGRQSHSNSEVNGATPAVRAALAVAQDYPVFPCALIPGPGGKSQKKPLITDWPHAASQDAAIVRRWWAKYPDAYVGVPMGSRGGLVAIDVDPEGHEWYREHKGRLGAYRTHSTQRGKHLLYRYPRGAEVHNSGGQLAKGIDVRGEGGFLLWWPAHGGVAVGEPGELPKWLLKRLQQPSHKLNGKTPPSEPEEVVGEGGRSEWLSRRAYALVKAGWGEEKILTDLKALNAYYCKPPVSDKELQTIARGKRKFVNSADASAIVLKMSEIEEEDVDWLWKGFLARNKVHVIAGAGATMKSTLTLSLAATVTRGGKWPDGTRCPRGNVILWTGEDDLGDTVKPRFRWAGGDQDKCTVLTGVKEDSIERAFDPGQDIELLDKECTRLEDVSLIIIDPIVVIVQKDNNSVSDVRRALVPLQHLAKKHHCVVLGIQHFNKGSKGKDPVERITGSGGWSQAPRIVLATAPIVDGEGKDPTKYVFTCIKTFAKKKDGGYEYGFEEEPKTEIARIVWGKRLEGTGMHIIMEAEGGDDGQSKLGAAKKFLRELLSKGPLNGFEVKRRYEDAGITRMTFKRAKDELEIKPVRVGKNMFRWYLPEDNSANSGEGE